MKYFVGVVSVCLRAFTYTRGRERSAGDEEKLILVVQTFSSLITKTAAFVLNLIRG